MSQVSPYDNGQILSYDDGEVLLFADTTSPITVSTVTHTVMQGDTFQSIAWKYYRDSGYWYLIVLANKILNPLIELSPGQVLLIP